MSLALDSTLSTGRSRVEFLSTGNEYPESETTTLLTLLEAVHVQRTLWGVIQLSEGTGVWASSAYDVRFILMLKGSSYLEIGNDLTHMACGDFALMPRGSEYVLRQSPRSQLTCANFLREVDRKRGIPCLKLGTGKTSAVALCATIGVDFTRWGPIAKRLPGIIHARSPDGALPHWSGPLNDLASLALTSLGLGSETLLCRYADICIIQSLRAYVNHQRSDRDSPSTTIFIDPRVNKVLRLLNASPEANWTVPQLARDVGMSRSSLVSTFRLNIGEAPMRYLTKIRMSRAAELLRLDTIPLPRLASHVGYSSETAFCRIFKRHYGLTPRNYRKAQSAKASK